MKFLILILLFISSFVPSQEQSQEIEHLKDRYDIIISEIYPLTYTGSDGMLTGFVYQLLEEFSDINDIEINYTILPWAEALRRMRNAQGDIISNVAYSRERDEFLTYSNISILITHGSIYTAIGDEDVETIFDLENKRIGLVRDNINAIDFIKYAENFNVNINNIYYDSFIEVIEAIQNQEVDAGALPSIIYPNYFGLIEPTPILFSPVEVFVASTEGTNQIFLDLFDRQLKYWQDDIDSIYYELYTKYFYYESNEKFPTWLIFFFILLGFIAILSVLWAVFLNKRIKIVTKRIREQERKSASILMNINSGFAYHKMIYDKNGSPIDYEFIEANEKFYDLTKIPGNVIGKTITEINPNINQENANWIEKYNKTAQFGEAQEFEEYAESIGRWFHISTYSPEKGTFVTLFNDVSDIKEYQKSLEESNKIFTYVMRATNDGIWDWQINNNAVYFSDTYYTMLGYEIGEFNPSYNSWKNLLHPDDKLETISIVEDAIRQIKQFTVEFRMLKKDQDYMWIMARGEVVEINEDGSARRVVGTHTDIDTLKRIEETLKQSEHALKENQERLAITFESIGDAVVAVDNNLKVTMMNKVAKEILEWHKSFYDTDLDEIFPFEKISAGGSSIKQLAKQVLKNKQQITIGSANFLIDGERKVIEDSIAPIYDGENIYGLVIVFRDITSKTTQEKKTQELEEQLKQSQKMEAVGQFSGGIAHNFNNIITAISGYASIIQQEKDHNFIFNEELEEILKGTSRAAELTKQLLTVSRKQITSKDLVSMDNVVSNLILMMRQITGENIEIETQLNSKSFIEADISQIEQILLNLVANARDAINSSDNAKKKITIKTLDAEVDQSDLSKHIGLTEKLYVVLSVSDSGIGMDEETKRKAFDPFFTTKEKEKGSGLGLSTVYGIIKQNNAVIDVESYPKRGTTFNIFWPVTSSDKLHEKSKVVEKHHNHVEGKEKILFVEDEESLQKLGTTYLKKNGYDVILAFNGQDAFEKYDDSIDIIVTDIVMPKMTGTELYDRLKEKKDNIKILFTSGYIQDNKIKEDGNVDPDKNFISKPYSLPALVAKIREILES